MILSALVSALLVAICTSVHYGILTAAARAADPARRVGPALAVAVAFISVAHVIEATIYAAGFWTGTFVLEIGRLVSSGGGTVHSFMDHFYFSLVNFTTLGRGDLTPEGHLRFMTAIEAFHGFLLITASGSYVLQVMSGRNPFGRE
ncbi:MAG: ion channel [Hasllibacter sp.]